MTQEIPSGSGVLPLALATGRRLTRLMDRLLRAREDARAETLLDALELVATALTVDRTK